MNKKATILIIIVFLLLAGGSFLSLYMGRVKYNDANATGNTAGNLYNKGLFCEDEGLVYFSNPYDGNALYSMTPDETDFKKLLDYHVTYINSEGSYLYYYQDSSRASANLGFAGRMVGIYRAKKSGKQVTCLTRDPSCTISLAGNYLYYQHYGDTDAVTLYKTKIDKKENLQIADYIIDPSSVKDGCIFFAGTKNDHSLYMLDTATDEISTVYEGSVWNPTADGDYVYYMNVQDDYKLYRYCLSSGEDIKLTDDRIDTYNLAGDYIYYQKNSTTEPALKRMRTDGTEPELVMDGNFEHINATSKNVYFNTYDAPSPIYKTAVSGAIDVQVFDAPVLQ